MLLPSVNSWPLAVVIVGLSEGGALTETFTTLSNYKLTFFLNFRCEFPYAMSSILTLKCSPSNWDLERRSLKVWRNVLCLLL